jgi:beta-phosphoglucomutase-like phosphatase (HAD superfamily)
MLKAILFDFDGLILDTETPEYLAWQDIYREQGFELPHDEWGKIIGGYGLSDFDAAEHLSRLTQGRLDSASLRFRHQLESFSAIERASILPGVMDMIHAAKRHGLKLAIASSSPHSWVDTHAKRLGIFHLFDGSSARTMLELAGPSQTQTCSFWRWISYRSRRMRRSSLRIPRTVCWRRDGRASSSWLSPIRSQPD